MGSRAVVVVCRDEDVGAARASASTGEARRRLHAHRPAVLRRPALEAGCSSASAPRVDARRPVGRARDRLARARRRAAAVVGEGAGADPAPVRGGRRGGAARRWPRAVARARAAAARGAGRRRRCSTARATARTRRRRATSTRTAATAGRSTALDDLRLAPFHLLAAERARPRRPATTPGTSSTATRSPPPTRTGPAATDRRVVDVTDPARRGRGDRVVGGADRGAAARAWSSSRSTFIARGRRGLVQPGVKCRGPRVPADHLRPRVRRAANQSSGCARAASAASARSPSREFALGIEALERFVRREPLRRVHECVFGVLALESEPVDPRL